MSTSDQDRQSEQFSLAAQTRPLQMPVRGVYALTPDIDDTHELLAKVGAVLRGGAVLLQYRNKRASAALARAQASELLTICDHFCVPLIVNDDPALAQWVGAAGVHLGASDAGLAVMRTVLGPDPIIGSSCYNQIQRAEQAAANGASYIAFGAFHRSPTKPNAATADPSLLQQSAHLGLPRVAIGGINADNAAALIAAGADLLAVISAVFDAADPEQATRELAALF